jgi:hypothetical protein
VKKIVFSVFLVISVFGFLKAQMFDVNKPFFKGEDFFRPEFIKKNKIQSMFGEINTKQSMQIIKNQHLLQHYTFNNNGQLEKYTYTYFNGNKIDTNVVFYQYDTSGNLIKIRQSDKFGFTSTDFEYDTANRLIKKTTSREENKLASKTKFELKRKYELSSESYDYSEISPTQHQQKFYNNSGRLYKIKTIYFDTLGYKKSEESKYIIGGQREIITYQYDSIGRINKRTIEIIFNGIRNKEYYTYKYDEFGNIMQVKHYKGELLEYQQELVYYPETRLLKGLIEKDAGTEMLTIIKYQYTFFDE